jgi:hypothetical protein
MITIHTVYLTVRVKRNRHKILFVRVRSYLAISSCAVECAALQRLPPLSLYQFCRRISRHPQQARAIPSGSHRSWHPHPDPAGSGSLVRIQSCVLTSGCCRSLNNFLYPEYPYTLNWIPQILTPSYGSRRSSHSHPDPADLCTRIRIARILALSSGS